MEYTELEVCKESNILMDMLYEITKGFPKDELYGFINYYKNNKG